MPRAEFIALYSRIRRYVKPVCRHCHSYLPLTPADYRYDVSQLLGAKAANFSISADAPSVWKTEHGSVIDRELGAACAIRGSKDPAKRVKTPPSGPSANPKSDADYGGVDTCNSIDCPSEFHLPGARVAPTRAEREGKQIEPDNRIGWDRGRKWETPYGLPESYLVPADAANAAKPYSCTMDERLYGKEDGCWATNQK